MPQIIVEKTQLNQYRATYQDKFGVGKTPAEAIGYLFVANNLDFVQEFDVKFPIEQYIDQKNRLTNDS